MGISQQGNDSSTSGQRMADRRLLDKMRSKLVTTVQPKGQVPRSATSLPTAAAVSGKVRSAALLGVVVLMVAAANVFSYLERDNLVVKVDFEPDALLAKPGKNWKADEKAMYWAYAAYSPAKFDARFGPLPEGQVVNRQKAAKELKILLQKADLNQIVRSEIEALMNSRSARARP